MRRYLPLFLLMGLLTIGNVSSTDCFYAYAEYAGDTGYLDAGEGQDSIPVYYTWDWDDTIDPQHDPQVKFLVKRFTRCHDIDFYSEMLWAACKIVIDEGPHKGENGWVDVWTFHED